MQPGPIVIWCLDEHDSGICCGHERDMLRSESITHTAEQHYALYNSDHPGLLAAICNDRENHTRIGAWDGVLAGFEHPDLKTAAEANIRAWWSRELQRNGNRLPLSISRLDEYAASPIDYFFNRVLRLQPLEQYQDDAESNVKGLIVHSILQHFYTPDSPHSKVEMVHPTQDLTKATKRLDEIMVSVLDEYGNQLGYVDSPFPELLKTNIRKLTGWFLRAELEIRDKLNEDSYLPASFVPEAGLGMEYRWNFTRTWNGTDVLMNGFIDRIDVHPGLKKAVVYDYKTGTYVKTYENITDGMSYQLPMYFLALKERGYESLGGAYYKVPIGKKAADVEADYHFGSLEVLGKYADKLNTRNKKKKAFMPDEDLNTVLHEVEKRAEWIMNALRNGVFNLSLTGKVKWSDYNAISRYSHKVQKLREQTERQAAEHAGVALNRFYLAGSSTPDDTAEGGD
jgi:hypothetical protein